MTIATREEWLSATLKTERVPAPELGPDREVIIREMTASLRERYGESQTYLDTEDLDDEGQPKRKFKRIGSAARLVIFSLVDDAGDFVFAGKDGEPDVSDQTVAAVGKQSSSLLERIGKAVHRLNGLDEESKETTKKN